MNPQEKAAWYTLAVIALALVAYFTMLILTRHPAGSQAGFALLGLLGSLGSRAATSKDDIVGDERDKAIALKAIQISFQVFWLYFVGYCMVAVRFWDYREYVPSYLFTTFVMTGMCVMLGTKAIATLVLYRAGATEKRTMAEMYRNMSDIHRTGLWMMTIGLCSIAPFIVLMLKIGKGEFSLQISYMGCGGFGVIYLLTRYYLGRGVRTDENAVVLSWVRRKGDTTLLIGCFAVILSLALVWLVPLDRAALPIISMILFMVIVGAWLTLGLSAILSGTGLVHKQSASAKERPDA